MNGLQIRHVVMSVLARIKEGMTLIQVDCATKSRSDFKREMLVLAEEADFNIIVLALSGVFNIIRGATGSPDTHTDVQSETRTVFIVGTVRTTVEFNEEVGEICFTFTDRRGEADRAEQIASEQINRIMGLVL